jgi:hypothetical protein
MSMSTTHEKPVIGEVVDMDMGEAPRKSAEQIETLAETANPPAAANGRIRRVF